VFSLSRWNTPQTTLSTIVESNNKTDSIIPDNTSAVQFYGCDGGRMRRRKRHKLEHWPPLDELCKREGTRLSRSKFFSFS
jgi:hypothetical protein